MAKMPANTIITPGAITANSALPPADMSGNQRVRPGSGLAIRKLAAFAVTIARTILPLRPGEICAR